MNRFSYVRAGGVIEAVSESAGKEGAQFIAGGTNLIDLMKENVTRPSRLIDVSRLPLNEIERTADGGLRLGALVTNADTAWHPEVERSYPLLAKAILAGASPQIRNMATNGGNLLQRTRCSYFYDLATPCNKREPGSGCSAIEGYNRMHAILGASMQCIAVHPSDMCVALAALEAKVIVTGKRGERIIPFADFHRLPGDEPHFDANLRAGEIITAIELPPRGFAEHYTYLKVRDRTSYAFALVSVAAALEMEEDIITEARLALGGVAHKPWRDQKAESLLEGESATREKFENVAGELLRDAQGFGDNDFKIELARRAIVRALRQAVQMEQDNDHQIHRTTTEPR
jgi:xanthine dehydrogenase YagS FAD-binding subunit